MKSAPFDYHAPATLDEAAALLGTLDDAKIIAGGQSLAPLLAMRLSRFDHLVDLRRVPGLAGIEDRGESLWIGASTTQAAAEHSPEVAAAVPLLARALPLVGHFQIRNRGTVGGSIAHADPSAELPAVALALDATMETISSRGRRSIPAADFFTGFWSTALDEDEIVTGVVFPARGKRGGWAVEEVARRHGDFAVAGACVALDVNEGGTVDRLTVALMGLGSTPVRADRAEGSVVGRRADEIDPTALGRDAMADLDSVPSDASGSASYRTRVGAAVVSRAWQQAVEEALRA